ncbi:flavin reductase family protein [Paenibacillus validus]|uniref:Flavin reductase n=1 Tax=Paenibacillus validus TaxID=44253 RepID=A0A7X2ZB55_9BACL|nr:MULTISPECIES: flavin reductase family protein [Paenibacillus]MED4601987.1 flavin reductase family protein [Paenibacillus validus]MED4608016.1 flavin reductase family protein [Paenibacillus validus]MUG71582.1 flavin reductase [Paenibacillus validus]
MDDRTFRNAMGKFVTGVTVITTGAGEEVHGMTANAFLSVSLNPRLVLISIGEKAKMLDKIKESGRYAVSFLAADQQETSMLFAGQIKDGRTLDFEWFDRMPVIKGALGHLTCRVVSEHVVGDHTLFVGEVSDIQLNEGEPLIYFQGKYRELASINEQRLSS